VSSVTECCQSVSKSGSEEHPCAVGNINEKPLGIMSRSVIKILEQKNRNGVRQLSSALITASSLTIVLYIEHSIREKPFSVEYLKLNSSMYTTRVSRERA